MKSALRIAGTVASILALLIAMLIVAALILSGVWLAWVN